MTTTFAPGSLETEELEQLFEDHDLECAKEDCDKLAAWMSSCPKCEYELPVCTPHKDLWLAGQAAGFIIHCGICRTRIPFIRFRPI